MKKFSFILLLITSSFCCAQVFKIGTSVDFKKRDFYWNINGFYTKNNHQVGLATGFGMTRAFVQNHLLAQISPSYEYCFWKHDFVQLYANFTCSYQTMTLGKTTNQRLHLVEELAGFSYEIGNKWRFKNSILGGLYSEFIQPKLLTLGHHFGFQFTLGLLYAL